jgi:hydrogenase expression/formation protein HypE
MEDHITLAHGAGGEAGRQLVEEVISPAFGNFPLGDSAVFKGNNKIAFTTDSFVVKPLFFPGGDIGKLAVNGTVNDLSVSGAIPMYLSAGFIIEDGFPLADLKKILLSMSEAADKANISIVTGDTKVVEHGHGDGIYINTSGVGYFQKEFVSTGRPLPGDDLIVTGTLGNHGLAVMVARNGFEFDPPIKSDCAPLNILAQNAVRIGGVRTMRDPTRGGLTATLCEWAYDGIEITVDESEIPVRENVKAACNILGLDPMSAANEGIMVLSVSEKKTDEIIETLRQNETGRDTKKIGHVTEGKGEVFINTGIGTSRELFLPRGELLPRIC